MKEGNDKTSGLSFFRGMGNQVCITRSSFEEAAIVIATGVRQTPMQPL
jgi:hypothetical protein